MKGVDTDQTITQVVSGRSKDNVTKIEIVKKI